MRRAELLDLVVDLFQILQQASGGDSGGISPLDGPSASSFIS